MSEGKNIQIIKTDLTIKVILTVIAILLGVIAVSQMSHSAEAQGVGCGVDAFKPCYVRVVG